MGSDEMRAAGWPIEHADPLERRFGDPNYRPLGDVDVSTKSGMLD